jgi:hypothetical protein
VNAANRIYGIEAIDVPEKSEPAGLLVPDSSPEGNPPITPIAGSVEKIGRQFD